MLLAMLGQMGTIPLASNPGVPSALVFGPGIEQAIAKLLEKLNEELNRGQQQYDPDLLSSPFTNLGGTELKPATGSGNIRELSGEPGPGESFGPNLFGPGQFGNGTGTGPNQPLPAGPDTEISRERSTVSGSATGNPYGPTSVSPAAAAGLFPGYAPSSVSESAPGTTANGNGVSRPASVQPWDAATAAIAGGGVGMETGIRGTNQLAGYAGMGQQPEFTVPVPRPGSTISSWPEQPQWNQPSGSIPTSNAIGNADLLRQPGLLAKLFPSIAGTGKRGRSTK